MMMKTTRLCVDSVVVGKRVGCRGVLGQDGKLHATPTTEMQQIATATQKMQQVVIAIIAPHATTAVQKNAQKKPAVFFMLRKRKSQQREIALQ